MSEKKFKFYIGDESRVVIEDIDKRKESIFSEVYAKTFKVMNDTLGLILSDKNLIKKKNQEDNTCPSNIYAFVGDRGTGKTSCMRSVAEMLKSNNSFGKLLPNFSEKEFEVLDSTDPSFFTNDRNILDIFIGRLFSKFKYYVEKNGSEKEYEKNEVFKAFECVKESLTRMSKRNLCDDDTVDQLMGLSASVELQNNIHKLINLYLSYINKDFLVIPVDDIDLHTIYAFDMAEQIRKYLTQENTVILMALKIEQLEYAIERHYLRHYKDMIEKGFIDGTKISDMASKYMIKLIPQAHRFPLKSVEELVNEPVEIIENGNIIPFKESILKDIITALIFKKTRYLFYHLQRGNSPIIPHTLREVRHLLDFLYRMPDYNENEDGNYNKRQFEDYFFNIWIPHNCGAYNSSILVEFFKCQEIASFNRNVIQNLKKIFFGDNDNNRVSLYRTMIDDDDDDGNNLHKIINGLNNAYNISIGDVFAIIRYCENVFTDKSAFFFALKFIYSLKLYNSYNRLVDEVSEGCSEKEGLRKNLARDRLPDYKILVGGSFFNFDKLNANNSTNRFDYRAISIFEIRSKLDLCVGKMHEIKNEDLFHVIEFYALSLSRKYYWENEASFRKSEDFIYDSKYAIDDYAIFDTFSIFANITDVKRCYEKISPILWEAAKKETNNSLYNKIKKYCENDRTSQNPFLSCCCIRNVDILDSLDVSLRKIEPSYQDEFIDKTFLDYQVHDELCYNLITDAYAIIASFSKKTYDLNNNGEYFEIKFLFGPAIYECLVQKNDKDEIVGGNENFKKEFLKIYSGTTLVKQKIINKISEILKGKIESNPEVLDSRGAMSSLIQDIPLRRSMPALKKYIREDVPYLTRLRSIEAKRDRFVNDVVGFLQSLPVID
ncbi:hypothetical protein [Fibrobacter sp. UWB10]|uniref:hypothetical protein n=1 Tax=Fibrobacter sp. UWB10 TaxID=1896201 RepID=UPI0024035022|nr:hypothetical protein [Fibrobacter sp. UWB10]SMP42749.1 hypothetical protein SAMN05720465_0803 [Fibrobacter sp. UWB10]